MDKTTLGQIVYLLFGCYVGYILFDYFLYRADFKKRFPLHIAITVVSILLLYFLNT